MCQTVMVVVLSVSACARSSVSLSLCHHILGDIHLHCNKLISITFHEQVSFECCGVISFLRHAPDTATPANVRERGSFLFHYQASAIPIYPLQYVTSPFHVPCSYLRCIVQIYMSSYYQTLSFNFNTF